MRLGVMGQLHSRHSLTTPQNMGCHAAEQSHARPGLCVGARRLGGQPPGAAGRVAVLTVYSEDATI